MIITQKLNMRQKRKIKVVIDMLTFINDTFIGIGVKALALTFYIFICLKVGNDLGRFVYF